MLVYRSDHRAQSRTVQALMKGNGKQDPETSYCGAGRQIVDEAISQIHTTSSFMSTGAVEEPRAGAL